MLCLAQAGAVAEQRAAQEERLQAWLPVMHAQIKKTKGKEKKSFTMVRSPCHIPDCLQLLVPGWYALLNGVCMFAIYNLHWGCRAADGPVYVYYGDGMKPRE